MCLAVPLLPSASVRPLSALLAAGGLLTVPSTAVCQEPAPEGTDILVQAKRYGEAKTPAEREFDEQDIEAFGANSVGELLKGISPMVDAPGQKQAVIVNGKRVADPAVINSLPPEALQRVEVLPDEAAGEYGFSGEQRVVNVVLKKAYKSLFADGSAQAPTQGGPVNGRSSVQFSLIDGEKYWSAGASLNYQADLLEADRTITPAPGYFATGGNMFAPGGELDPALSALAGFPVSVAAVPADLHDPAVLEDFLAGAELPNPRDDAALRSLQPSSRGATVNLSVTRPIGGLSVSTGIYASLTGSRKLLGLPEASLLLPAASPFSPFAGDVLLQRLLPGEALVSEQNGTSFSVFASTSLPLGKQFVMASLSYGWQQADSTTERGYDLSGAQARIAAADPTLDPFGPLSAGATLTDRVSSTSQNWSARLSWEGQLAQLPAGPISTSLEASYIGATSKTASENGGVPTEKSQSSNRTDTTLYLGFPVASRRLGVLPALGELQLRFSGGTSTGAEGFRVQYGGGVGWQPIESLTLNANVLLFSAAPSYEQISAPRLETPGTRFYDYSRGELTEITQITGGNPDLSGGETTVLMLGADFRPLGWAGPSFGTDYRRTRTVGGVGSLPPLTPVIEAAFPDRVVRDAEGRLVSVDFRPLNLAREQSETLRTSVGWWLGLGPKEQPAPVDAAPVAEGGIPPRPKDRTRLMFSLGHEFLLSDTLLVREGVPLLDRLDGQGGGKSRHNLQFNARLGHRKISGGLGVGWRSGYTTRVAAPGSQSVNDLHYASAFAANLEFDLELGDVIFGGRETWLKGTRLSVDVQNLFDGRQKVTRADGTIPPGYLRDDIDALGRTVRIGLRRSL